jgi:hypothetical protein
MLAIGTLPKPGQVIFSYREAGYSKRTRLRVIGVWPKNICVSRESITMVVLANRFLENERAID